MRCSGCYDSFSGPWCDNCDTWPCGCAEDAGLTTIECARVVDVTIGPGGPGEILSVGPGGSDA